MFGRVLKPTFAYLCVCLTSLQTTFSATSAESFATKNTTEADHVTNVVLAAADRPQINNEIKSDRFVFRLSEDKDSTLGNEQPSKDLNVKGEPLSESEINRLFERVPEMKPESKLPIFVRSKTAAPPPSGKNLSQSSSAIKKDSPTQNAPPLKVVQMRPTGEAPSNARITVTFSQPMIPMSSVGQLAQVPASVSAVEGEWNWVGTQTMIFVPKAGRLPMSSSFEITVKGGLKSQTGGVLAHDAKSKFSTATTCVIHSSLPLQGESPQQVPLKPAVFFAFNQQIRPEEIAKKISFHRDSGTIASELVDVAEAKTDNSLKRFIESAQKGTFLVIRPCEPLPANEHVQITMSSALPSAEGPNLSSSKHTYKLVTYAPFQYLKTTSEPAYYDPEFFWVFSFTQRIKSQAQDLASLVKLEPPIENMEIFSAGRGIVVRACSKGGTKHRVTFAPSLEDEFGQKLGKSLSLIAEVPHNLPELKQPSQRFAVLPPEQNLQHIIRSINYKKLHVEIFRVKPSDWETFGEHDHSNTWKLLASKDINLPGKADQHDRTPLELNSLMKGGTNNIVVHIRTTESSQKKTKEYSLWLQKTHLSVDAFIDHNRALVWVTDLRTGEPVQGAKVSIYPSGEGSGVTDKNGILKLDLTQNGIESIFVQKGADQAFLPATMWKFSDWQKRAQGDTTLWYVVSDRNTYKPGEQARFKGWLRSMQHTPDGDTIPVIKTKSVKFIAYDGSQTEICKGDANLNSLGGFDFAVTLPPSCNTGFASVKLKAAEGADQSDEYSSQFKIAEFRRSEFELKLQNTGPATHVIGGHATITASTSYFSGGNIGNAAIKWTARALPGHYTPPGRNEYQFGRDGAGLRLNPAPEELTLNGRTNSAGMFNLRTDFDTVEPPQPIAIDLSATVKDVNSQQWTTKTNLLVHSSKYYVGMKIDKRKLRISGQLKVSVIVCDIDGKAVNDGDFELILTKCEFDHRSHKMWQKELVKQSLGFEGGERTVELPILQKGFFSLTARIKDPEGRKNQSNVSFYVMDDFHEWDQSVGTENMVLIPDKREYQPGEIAKIQVRSAFRKAHGLMTVCRSGLLKNNTFEMSSNATTIKVPISDGYLPNVLVKVELVEDNSQSTNSKSFARIAVKELNIAVSKIQRKLFIEVKPGASTSLPGSISDLEITIRDSGGNPVKDADAVVAVVDESVLALSKYQFTDPLSVMYPKRTSNVFDYHLGSQILMPAAEQNSLGPQSEKWEANDDLNIFELTRGAGLPAGPWVNKLPGLGSPSGNLSLRMEGVNTPDDGSSDKKTNVGQEASSGPWISLRSNFDSLAFYDPTARTNNEGRIKLKFKLPDSSGRYKIMVAAASGRNLFGYADASLVAQLPLSLKPSPPRFLNLGDSFELPVVLQNLSANPISAKIAVRANKISFPETRGRQITIPPKGRVQTSFPAKANEVGNAKIQLVLADSTNSDATELTLPIYTPTTTETFATYGDSEEDQSVVEQSIRIPSNVFSQVGELQVSTSSTALQTLTDAFIYLYNYPYGCTEQLSSRILAIDALKNMLGTMKSEGMPSEDSIASAIKNDISQIESRQMEKGGFQLWDAPYDCPPPPFASVHAAHALERARIGGYSVSPQVREKYREYLRNVKREIPADFNKASEWSVRSYAAYVRSLYDPIRAWDDAHILAKEIHLDEAPLETLGWLIPVLTLKPSAELSKLREYLHNHIEETAGKASIVRTSNSSQNYLVYWSDTREDAVILNGMIADHDQNDYLNQKLIKSLIAHRKAGRWDNTQENAFVLMAMRKYFDKYESSKPDFLVRVWLGEDFLGEHNFNGYNTDNANVDVPMSFLETLNSDNKVVLSKRGKGRMYYRIALNYAPKELQHKPVDRGFAVHRTYEAVEREEDVERLEDGTWKIKAGATVRVKLTMNTPGLRHHVALVDPLPAGLEPINTELEGNEDLTNRDATRSGSASVLGSDATMSAGWYEHQNLRDERAEAFATTIQEGDYSYSYMARATTSGKFVASPPKAEEMYTSETFGRGQSDTVVIVPE